MALWAATGSGVSGHGSVAYIWGPKYLWSHIFYPITISWDSSWVSACLPLAGQATSMFQNLCFSYGPLFLGPFYHILVQFFKTLLLAASPSSHIYSGWHSRICLFIYVITQKPKCTCVCYPARFQFAIDYIRVILLKLPLKYCASAD